MEWFKDYINAVYPVTKGKYRIPLSITEFPIEKEKFEEIKEKLSIIFEKIKEIVFYFLDKNLKGYLIDDFRKELYLRIYENYNFKFKGVVRFDLINFKLIEINADAVEGVIQLDITAGWFTKNLDFKGKPQYNTPLFKELFDGKAIIIYPEGYKFVDEYYLEAKELNTEYISEKEFYSKFEEIKSNYGIFRRAIDIDKVKNMEPWLEKQNVNDILFTIIGNKANLAYLYDFMDDELKYAIDIVAKTSLKPEFKRYVSKPPFGTWGNVKFNEKVEGWVYQEYIEVPQAKIKYIDIDDKIKEDVFYYDFDPYAFYDNKLKFGNILLRFSKSKILNVAKGGGVGFWTIS